MFVSRRFRQLLGLGSVSLAAVLMSGCANMATTATTVTGLSASPLTGSVHGGQNPIGGATITLWAAGNTGYGSAATMLARTTSNSGGGFSLSTATCPTAPGASQYLYITAIGGTTGGIAAANANSALVAPLGLCTTLLAVPQQPIIINEETTIASMFALGQFFQPSNSGSGSFGTSATNLTGLANAMNTAQLLVSNTQGQSIVTTATGAVAGYSTAPVVTITPEISKINTLADILAACINSDPTSSNACNTLDSNVSATAALDTMQAAYYMSVNPTSTVGGTSNVNTLYGLAQGNSAPFAPGLTSAPADWTLGVTYGSGSFSDAGVPLINEPQNVAIDGSGNVWMLNFSTNTGTLNNSVTELSPAGVPLKQVLTTSLYNPNNLMIDPSNNVWVAAPGYTSTTNTSTPTTSVVEYTTAGATNSFTVSAAPRQLASDGAGNVFVYSFVTASGALGEIPAGSANGATASTIFTTSGSQSSRFSGVAVDSNFTVFLTGGGASGATTGTPVVYQFPRSSTGTYASNSSFGGSLAPETGLAIDGANNVFVGDYMKSTVTEFTGTPTATANSKSPITVPNLTVPQYAVIDGAGSFWVTNAISSTSKTGANNSSVFALSNAGALLAPSTGFTHTYAEAYGIAVDGSGNVWLGNYSGTLPAGQTQPFVTQIVGAAAPVVTPVAAGLPKVAGGASRLGTRP